MYEPIGDLSETRRTEEDFPEEEAPNGKPERRKVLLDISLFALELLDPDKIAEKVATSPFSFEVPSAFVTMIWEAQNSEASLLADLVYVYLCRIHPPKQRIKLLSSRIRLRWRTSEEETHLREKAAHIARKIITEYAPLIEGGIQLSSESSAEEPTVSDNNSADELGELERGDRPETQAIRHPIQRYEAPISVDPEIRTKLKQAYIKELGLPEHPLLELYFLQVYHGLRFGIAASPIVRRRLFSAGRSTSRVLSVLNSLLGGRQASSVSSGEPEPQAGDNEQGILEVARTILRDN